MSKQDGVEEAAENPLTDGMLGIKEAMEFSRLSRSELYAAMAKMELRFYRYGRRRLFARKDLVAWLSAKLTASTAE